MLMSELFEYNRARKIIESAIQLLHLDLSGLVVLTEVGTGVFNFLPIISQLAGASKVYAHARDSNYGTAEEAISSLENKMKYYGIDHNNFFVSKNNVPISY